MRRREVAMVEAEGREFPFTGPEQVTPGVLEVFPYEYPGREAEVEIVTDEWNCVCPFSGLPDFGTLTIRYVPTEVCIELKSLKYYLTSYRTVGIYQEHAANRILDDFVAAVKPRWAALVAEFNVRGGITTVVRCSYRPRRR